MGFTLKRIFSALLGLLMVLTATFFLLRLAPGGPFDSEQAWSAEIKTSIERNYGLISP